MRKKTAKRVALRVIASKRIKKSPSRVKVSETYSEMISGLDSGVIQRSKNTRMTLKDQKEDSNFWEFQSNTGHTVQIKGDPRYSEDELDSADLLVSCSCPYWRWSGPEYHAKKENYLEGSPRGTASPPDIKDPERDNVVCKHVYRSLKSIFE